MATSPSFPLVSGRNGHRHAGHVEGHRWAIEDSFETAKTELGLDHNETRSWHGWRRHVSLVMLAFAMMAAIRHRAKQCTNKQTIPQIFAGRRLSVGPFRKSAA